MPATLGQRGDPAEFGVHTGGEHHGRRVPGDTAGAAEHHVTRMDQRHLTVGAVGAHAHGRRLTGQRRSVDLRHAVEQSCVGGDPITFGDHDDVARYQFPCIDLRFGVVAQDSCTLGQIGGEGFDRAIGVAFLHECECGVQGDDDHDRNGQGDRGRDRGKGGRNPQQQGEGMHELPAQGTKPAFARAAHQLVAAEYAHPALRLTCGQAGTGRSQVPQQTVERLERIDEWVSPALADLRSSHRIPPPVASRR